MISHTIKFCLIALPITLSFAIALVVAGSSACADELGTGVGGYSQATNSTTVVSDEVCGGGSDSTMIARCGFDALRTRIKTKGPACVAELKNILCHESMWSSLGLQERIQKVVRLAAKQSQTSGVDYRAIPCLTRRESIWFDPSIMTFGTCTTDTTDQGLGQVTFSTFKDMFESQGFRSKLPKFSGPPYTTDARSLFSAMAMSAELQMEVLQQVLAMKLRRGAGDYQQAFTFYNGAADRITYGQQVNACYQCIVGKMPASTPTEREIHTNIDECLDQALPGGGVDFSFTKFATECRGDTFDRWTYWTSRNIDPTTKGLDPVTHQPVEVKK